MNTLKQRGLVGGLLLGLIVLALLAAAYVWAVLTWVYSSGDRVGYMQKLSHKGLACKTWEGELLLVAVPGQAAEKFYFTVRNDAVAAQLNKLMGQRVALHYEEHIGVPTTCFGETMYYVTKATLVGEPLPAPAAAPTVAPAQVPAPVPAPAAAK